MTNTEIRLIIFFAAKGGEALYGQQKQERELTVAQIKKIWCIHMCMCVHVHVCDRMLLSQKKE